MTARSASASRGAVSSLARRSNRSLTSSRSCGVMASSRDDGPGYLGGRRGFASGGGKRDAMPREIGRERVRVEVSQFALAQVGERIEAFQRRVDIARMAHDQAAIRHAGEKAREQGMEVGFRREGVGAGEGRVRGDAEAGGAA